MGDKGGQKDKNKGQKQKAAKDAEKKKQKLDKQAKAKHVWVVGVRRTHASRTCGLMSLQPCTPSAPIPSPPRSAKAAWGRRPTRGRGVGGGVFRWDCL